jgi:hypothetical protein
MVLVDMHVQPQCVNTLMFLPFVKDKRGEPPMTSRLAALVKRVAELHKAGLKVCHCAEEDLHALFLLLEELAVIALGDDLHRIILSYNPVEIVPKCLAYDRTP